MFIYFKDMSRREKTCCTGLLIGFLLLLAIHYSPIRPVYVRTESIPTGLYLGIDLFDGDRLSVGDLATFRYQPPDWSLLHEWKVANRFTKIVLAVPGDRIRVDDDKFIYRENFDSTWTLIGTRAPTDSKGIPMSFNSLPLIVPQGFYYLGSDHPKGLDSRYLGLISSRDILQRVLPLLRS